TGALFAERFESAAEPGKLRRVGSGTPRPIVAQEAEVEVVGGVVGDVGGETSDEEPRLLRAAGERRGSAERAATEDAADVVLAVGDAGQFVIAIAGHEVPLVAEVVVEAGDSEVVALWNGHVAREGGN